MIKRYINDSVYSVDNFFQGDHSLYRLKINDYQVVTIFWNIGLMFVPWLVLMALRSLRRRGKLRGFGGGVLFVSLFALWLLFIPNTAYVMSEVRHLLDYCPRGSAFSICEENAWMPLFFFSYALVGWLFFVYLTGQMKHFLAELYGRFAGLVFIVFIMPLISLGFLLGLVNRWNSWEFFIYPAEFFRTAINYATEPLYFTNWLIFTIFLYILYWLGQYLFQDRFN